MTFLLLLKSSVHQVLVQTYIAVDICDIPDNIGKNVRMIVK